MLSFRCNRIFVLFSRIVSTIEGTEKERCGLFFPPVYQFHGGHYREGLFMIFETVERVVPSGVASDLGSGERVQ